MKKAGGNAADMRQRNGSAMLRMIYDNPVSRAGLARSLGLTRASVSGHIDGMISEGLVVETGTGETERGRKPVLLQVNAEFGCFAGLYINRQTVRFGLTDMKGRVIANRTVPDAGQMSPDSLLELVSCQVKELLDACKIPEKRLLGLGVSVPGPVDIPAGRLLMPPEFEAWHHYPVVEKVQGHFACPVCLDNNAASLTMAEMRFGYGRAYSKFIFLVVDSGIGGGIVIDGKPLKGVGGFGSELGHTSIVMDGRPCSCGNSGCLERYASVPALLRNSFTPEDGIKEWAQAVDLAIQGDSRAVKAIDREAAYLSAALVNFLNALEPQAMIIGGDLCDRPDLILSGIRKRISQTALMRQYRTVDVIASRQGTEHEILAAATIAIELFLQQAFS